MTLMNVLEEICAEEYALPANAPRHRFSRKHRRAVNAVLYLNGLPKTERKLKLKRRVLVASAIVVLAVMTGAACIIRYGGFQFSKGRIDGYDYFVMLTENAANAPKTIEKICYEYNVPEKYQRSDSLCHVSEDDAYEVYVDKNGFFFVWQITKSTFVNVIQPDQDECTPIEVKGYNGLLVVTTIDYDNGDKFIENGVLWDCGEYIHMVSGTVSMEEIMSIVDGMTEN